MCRRDFNRMPKIKQDLSNTVFLDTALTVETSIPQTVVFLLNAKEDELILKACQSLLAFAKGNAENRRLLYQQDAAPLLLKHVQHHNRDVRRIAAMALIQLAENCSVQDQLLSEDNAKKLINILGTERDCVLAEFASNILHTLCADTVGKASLLAFGALESLVFQLHSSDPDVLKNCLSSLVELLDDVQSAERFLHCNGIPGSLHILHSEYPVLQRLTLTLLRKVMDYEEGRRLLRESEGLSDLAKLLKDPSLGDLHRSVIAVLQLAIAEPSNSLELQRIGGLLTLLELLETSPSSDILSGCGECIAQMARCREISVILYQQNVNELLVKHLLSSTNPRCQTVGAMAIRWMSQTLGSQQQLIDLDAVPKIAALVDNVQATQATAQALAALSAHSQIACHQLCSCEQLKTLLDKLSADDEETVSHVAVIVRNLAEDVNMRDKVISIGRMIDNLCDCLKSVSRHVIAATCQALAVLCVDPRVKKRLYERQEIVTLVELLKSPLEDIRCEVINLLFIVCTDLKAAEQFCRHGGVELLCHLREQRVLQVVLHTNLSVRYSLLGKLERHHHTHDGFFDCGRQSDCRVILDLRGESEQPLCIHKLVLVLNSGVCPFPSDQEYLDDSTNNKSKNVKEEQKQLFIETISAPDARLKSYVEYCRRVIGHHGSDSQRAIQLAEFVSSRLGGPHPLKHLGQLSESDLHIDAVKKRLCSNVVPIGELEHGLFRPRALLFKFLADQLLLPVTLERGVSGRYWNCLFLDVPTAGMQMMTEIKVVDLLESPGALIPWRSYEARKYMEAP